MSPAAVRLSSSDATECVLPLSVFTSSGASVVWSYQKGRQLPGGSSAVDWIWSTHGRQLAIVHFRWPEQPLEQSAIRCHVSSNAHCFSELPQDTPLLKIISCITSNCFSVPISYTVDSSGLAVST